MIIRRATLGLTAIAVLSIAVLTFLPGVACSSKGSDTTSSVALPTTVAGRWVEKPGPSTLPHVRGDHSMVYVSSLKSVIMFGGGYGEAGGQGSFFSDTWSYDPVTNTWHELHPSGDLPSPRYKQSIVYDPDRDIILMYGGADMANSSSGGFGDFWKYDVKKNSWTALHPSGQAPPPRYVPAMAYDPASRTVLLFGGSSADLTDLNDLWQYNPQANTWKELQQSGPLPSARASSTLAYDPNSRRLILFGGFSQKSPGEPIPILADTDLWGFDSTATTWTELHPAGQPAPRPGFFAYDSAIRRFLAVYLQKSANGSGAFGMWSYDPVTNTGSLVQPAGELPPLRGDASFSVCPQTQELLLWGGSDSGLTALPARTPTYYNDVWAWSNG